MKNIFISAVCDCVFYINLFIILAVFHLIKWSILLKASIYLNFGTFSTYFLMVKGGIPASRVTIYPLKNF